MSLGGITQETIDMTKGVMANGPQGLKGITVASNYLYGYPLEAPAKKLYFIEDAMRRRIPRVQNPQGGTAAHWKQVTAINASKIKAAVAEAAINSDITFTDAEKSAIYRSLSMTGKYSDESRVMGRKFEDIPAFAMLSALQSLMIQEDRYIIGGNRSALGTPTGLAVVDSDVAGSLTASTAYDFGVSALTIHGWLNGAVGGTSADESIGGVITTFSTAGGKTSAVLSWTDVPGAFAYNVYITLHGGTYKYQKTVFCNKTNVSTIVSGAACNVGDLTADAYAFDGIAAQLIAGSSYYVSMAGAPLTSDGAAGVVQIETMLQSIWNTARTGPTMFLANAQEAKALKLLSVGSSTANAVRIMVEQGEGREFKAGSSVGTYWNPYMAQEIPIIVSVHCPPGKIFALAERVPYPNAETPNNFEIETAQEYFGQEIAKTDRSQKVIVSCIEALKVYFPPACGIIGNISPAAIT